MFLFHEEQNPDGAVIDEIEGEPRAEFVGQRGIDYDDVIADVGDPTSGTGSGNFRYAQLLRSSLALIRKAERISPGASKKFTSAGGGRGSERSIPSIAARIRRVSAI